VTLAGEPGRYRSGYDAVVAEGLTAACTVVAATFLLFVVWHPLSLEGVAMPVMTAVAAATAAAMGATAVHLRRRSVPSGRAHLIGGVLATLVFANCALQYSITQAAYLSVNVTLVLVAIGVCLVDPRWVAGLIGGLAAVWLLLVATVTSVDAALGGLSAMVLGSIVAALANVVRRGTLHRLLDAQAELRTLSHRDELTGLLNRRGFLEAAQARLDRGRPIRVWFIDVDDLKQVNDTRGHDVGDVLLVSVATALTDVFSGAVVARLSGDEFAVVEDHGVQAGVQEGVQAVVPTGAGQARAALEERLAEAARASDLPVSVSTGAATSAPGQTLSEVLSAADTAMYAVKSVRRAIRPAEVAARPAPAERSA
jgi:diguanylate cyclase (GGDEF)-like protein